MAWQVYGWTGIFGLLRWYRCVASVVKSYQNTRSWTNGVYGRQPVESPSDVSRVGSFKVRLMTGMELPVPVLWIGEAGFGISMLMLPGAVYAEDPDKDEKFFGSILVLFGLLLIIGAAGIF